MVVGRGIVTFFVLTLELPVNMPKKTRFLPLMILRAKRSTWIQLENCYKKLFSFDSYNLKGKETKGPNPQNNNSNKNLPLYHRCRN